LILRLNLPLSHKIGVTILIALGYIVTIAGAVRSYYTYVVTFNTFDITWYSHYAYVASTVENDLAVICASLPVIRPLVHKAFHVMGSITSSSK